MRTSLFCVALMSVVLASCAESIHQRERMGLESAAYQAPPVAPESPLAPSSSGHVMSADGVPSLYAQVKATPADYRGKVISLSGTVLKAKRLNGLTEIEILQLPMGADGRPTTDLRQSPGRFLATQTTFLDPATLVNRPMVTVRGVVEGQVERPIEPGADNYSYPMLAIQELTVWPPELVESYAGSYAAPTSSTGLSRADGTGDFMLNLLGSILTGMVNAIFNPVQHDRGSSSYSLTSSSSSSSNPLPPPQKDIPPQFQKSK